ncbi:diaminopimelate decarboxylase [Neolewinella antarctica]|uniref:Diaminopimelate decarboxylase n=1 Tax=Neolewinella antarctica TaxID=442734 RepID=A0ABX0X834_9BACT|nr:diaminopimelate decarboxylase [Neolewinella antarctica]NJC24992.1 diaminopimelate decarboxylase [Neolewinella antarctica]
MLQLTNDRYTIGGVDALSIVERFDAPIYVYDSATMKRQYERMEGAFKQVKRLRINYACKALTNLNVLRLFRGLGSGLDTVSIQEVELGLLAGFDPHDILFTPNCVSLAEVEEAAAKGVRLNIDNISILEQFGTLHPSVPVCIRINPHIMAGGNSKISVGHIDSKFGISIHQVPHVLKVVKALGITVEGLHMHTGSDIYDAEVFIRAVEILLTAASDFPDLDYLDFGSGFKVAYKEGGIATDIEELGDKLGRRFNEFCGDYGRELELMFEPGKFLVSEAGYFLVRTNVVKTTTASVFAGVDSGLNHLIRPMFYESYHHITNISNAGSKKRIYNVVGYICETDTFGVNRQLSEVHEGDILAMANAGAYSFMMASNYNSRFRPAEVMVHDGEAFLIRERENMDDLLRGQVAIPSLERSTHEVEA